jgi:hypothetical protein
MAHKRIFVALATLGLAWAGAAAAQQDGATPAPEAGKTPKRICRSITPTGSRLTLRRCMSQAEWDARQDKAQEGMLKHQTDNTTLYEHQKGPG